eukprot:12912264-Prorocentrum_lima.AAC.1
MESHPGHARPLHAAKIHIPITNLMMLAWSHTPVTPNLLMLIKWTHTPVTPDLLMLAGRHTSATPNL